MKRRPGYKTPGQIANDLRAERQAANAERKAGRPRPAGRMVKPKPSAAISRRTGSPKPAYWPRPT